MDIKTAFLYGKLDEEIYLQPPPGYYQNNKQVWRLQRSLYGLKQAPRCWNELLHEYLLKIGFLQSSDDYGIYRNSQMKLLLAVYVDDLIITGKELKDINNFKESMRKRFQMTDMGETSYFLGVEIERNRREGTLKISQQKYAKQVLESFGMQDSNPVSTPVDLSVTLSQNMSPQEKDQKVEMEKIPYQNAVGSLNYLAIGTRPDIANAVGEVSRFNSNYGKQHWAAVKRIMRYIKGTASMGIIFSKDHGSSISGYSDANYATDIDERKSTSGYVFTLGGGAVSWKSKRQKSVAASTTEAEYMALKLASQEAKWLKRLYEFISGSTQGSIRIAEDNQGAIKLAKNPQFHERTKHIDVCYHFTREAINDGTISIYGCNTKDMVADLLTKGISRDQFEKLRSGMGMN